MKQIFRFFLFSLCLALGTQASAYTECTLSVQSVWSGDGGNVWLHFTNGGSAFVGPSDPDREGFLSLGATALVASRQVRIRYTANSVACNAGGRSDVEGLYLL